MGKSLVFKTPSGNPAGYIQQGQGKIRLKLHLPVHPDDAMVALLFEDGTLQRRAAPPGGQECSWPHDAQGLVAALVYGGMGPLAATGPQARKLLPSRRAQASGRDAPPAARAPAQHRDDSRFQQEEEESKPCAQAPSGISAANPAAGWILPERRWPPPPCCESARYEEGHWKVE